MGGQIGKMGSLTSMNTADDAESSVFKAAVDLQKSWDTHKNLQFHLTLRSTSPNSSISTLPSETLPTLPNPLTRVLRLLGSGSIYLNTTDRSWRSFSKSGQSVQEMYVRHEECYVRGLKDGGWGLAMRQVRERRLKNLRLDEMVMLCRVSMRSFFYFVLPLVLTRSARCCFDVYRFRYGGLRTFRAYKID